MGQSHTLSVVESTVNVTVGYMVAVGAQAVVFPRFGIEVSASENLAIGVIFTVVSLVRSYLLRRLFNRVLA
jgi:hypothetical protein